MEKRGGGWAERERGLLHSWGIPRKGKREEEGGAEMPLYSVTKTNSRCGHTCRNGGGLGVHWGGFA